MVSIPNFPIPEQVTPENRICVTFTIPDNETYRQVMVGWIDQLTYWFNWERDEGKNGATCSNLFKQSRDELIASLTEGCIVDDMYFRFRINPDDPCVTEAQYEPNGEWTPFLNQNCCCNAPGTLPTQSRVNPTTGASEISTDGGVTWTPSPDGVPFQITEAKPPVTAGVSGSKCDAATNGKQHFEDWIAGVSNAFTIAGTFFEFCVQVVLVIAGIILWILSVGALTVAEIAVIEAIAGALHQVFSLGKTAWDEYWTSDEKDKILCALVCNIGDDGSFNDSQWQGVITYLNAHLTPSPAKLLITAMIGQIGRQGLNNWCSYGASADADCSSCECTGCSLETWVVQVGTEDEDERTEFTITVDAVQTGENLWEVAVNSPGTGVDCCKMGNELLSGAPIVAIGAIDCAKAQDAGNIGFSYNGAGEVNYYILQATAGTFRVKVKGI